MRITPLDNIFRGILSTSTTLLLEVKVAVKKVAAFISQIQNF